MSVRYSDYLTHCDGQDCLQYAGGSHTEVCVIRDSEGIAIDHDSAACECIKQGYGKDDGLDGSEKTPLTSQVSQEDHNAST